MRDPDVNPAFIAPRTPTERRLAAIWVEVLGAEHVSINDTFLSAGGESIVALQCLNRIRADYGVDISPAIFFADDTTIAELAKIIDVARSERQPRDEN